MKRMLFTCALLLCAFCLMGCAGVARRLPPLAADGGAPYLLGTGDSLKVIVFGEAELTGTYKVADTGGVVLPIIGVVPARGLTVTELQQRLVERLSAKAVRAPDVTVQIEAYRPFYILGEVKNPGSYAYVPDMTVLTGVAIAGGFTFRAAEDEVSVTRQNAGGAREARAVRDARILPGDVIYVFERHF